MSNIFQPPPPEDPMVVRLTALRDEAEAAGYELLAQLIEVALMEAERIVEERAGTGSAQDRRFVSAPRVGPRGGE